jgi:hypothetical protein
LSYVSLVLLAVRHAPILNPPHRARKSPEMPY